MEGRLVLFKEPKVAQTLRIDATVRQVELLEQGGRLGGRNGLKDS